MGHTWTLFISPVWPLFYLHHTHARAQAASLARALRHTPTNAATTLHGSGRSASGPKNQRRVWRSPPFGARRQPCPAPLDVSGLNSLSLRATTLQEARGSPTPQPSGLPPAPSPSFAPPGHARPGGRAAPAATFANWSDPEAAPVGGEAAPEAGHAQGQNLQAGQRLPRQKQELQPDRQGESREGAAVPIHGPAKKEARHAVAVDTTCQRWL